jgi:hypothetical protein
MTVVENFSYPILGETSSIGFERRKQIQTETGVSIKYAGKSRGHYNIKLIGTTANISQARRLLNEAIDRSRRFYENSRTARTSRREHFEAPMVIEEQKSQPAVIGSKNLFDALLDDDGNAVPVPAEESDKSVESAVFVLATPKKLSKKDRQAHNKAMKGVTIDVSHHVKGQLQQLKKHNWERRMSQDAKKAKQAHDEKLELENSRWQLNPRFGNLSAKVQLFDNQIDGTHIGHIYIGDSGMGYFGYQVGDSDEHQIMLHTIDGNESYSGNRILTDKSRSDNLNEFLLDKEVTISVIVEDNDDDEEPNGGNAWVILGEDELSDRYYQQQINQHGIFNWGDEA